VATVTGESRELDPEWGGAATVSGEVELWASECRARVPIPLREGARSVSGLDAYRVTAVLPGEKRTSVTLRMRVVNLAFDRSKGHQTISNRILPWEGSTYALVNPNRGNEVVLCKSIRPADLWFMLNMFSRMGRPPRLDYADVQLSFPVVPQEWLEKAELVCIEEHKVWSIRKSFTATNVVVREAKTAQGERK
jgi:hypothetical protein